MSDSELYNIMESTNQLQQNINDTNVLIDNNNVSSDMQQKEIERKKDVLHTRERMLEIVKDKNDYKMKVIYILLSINVLIIIFGMLYFIKATKK